MVNKQVRSEGSWMHPMVSERVRKSFGVRMIFWSNSHGALFPSTLSQPQPSFLLDLRLCPLCTWVFASITLSSVIQGLFFHFFIHLLWAINFTFFSAHSGPPPCTQPQERHLATDLKMLTTEPFIIIKGDVEKSKKDRKKSALFTLEKKW